MCGNMVSAWRRNVDSMVLPTDIHTKQSDKLSLPVQGVLPKTVQNSPREPKLENQQEHSPTPRFAVE